MGSAVTLVCQRCGLIRHVVWQHQQLDGFSLQFVPQNIEDGKYTNSLAGLRSFFLDFGRVVQNALRFFPEESGEHKAARRTLQHASPVLAAYAECTLGGPCPLCQPDIVFIAYNIARGATLSHDKCDCLLL